MKRKGSQPKKALSESIKLLYWNYRGLRGPSTIAQLNESLRSYLPVVVFL